jgi:hypothetical protein
MTMATIPAPLLPSATVPASIAMPGDSSQFVLLYVFGIKSRHTCHLPPSCEKHQLPATEAFNGPDRYQRREEVCDTVEPGE